MLKKQDVSEQGIAIANNLFTDMETIMERQGNSDESRQALNNLLDRYQTSIDNDRDLSEHDQQVLAKLIFILHVHIEITVCNQRRCWLAAVIDILYVLVLP